MAAFPGAPASLAEITTSFWCPATSAPKGKSLRYSARWALTIALWLLKTGTVVIAALGGIGNGASFTCAAMYISFTIFLVGREQPTTSAIFWAVVGEIGVRK